MLSSAFAVPPEQRDPSQRVVITGLGAVSPFGLGATAFLDAIRAGRSAVAPVTEFDVEDCRCGHGARIEPMDLSFFDASGTFRRAPRASRFTVMATAEAFAQAVGEELPWDPERVGVCLGTYRAMTEVSEVLWSKLIESEPRFVPALLFQETVTNAVASAVSIRWGLRGTNYAISAGNACGHQVLFLGAHALLTGRAEAVVAGAFDLFTSANHHDMDDLGMLSPAGASRPFDRRRDGFVLGEGAAVVVLETLAGARRRGATVLAELAGLGIGHDAYAFAANHPDGVGLAEAVERALGSAVAEPDEIGYVGAAANSTRDLDLAESRALRRTLGAVADTVPVSSLKGATGEAMAASDLFNLIASVGAIRDGWLPPQIGTQEADPECGLNLVPLGHPRIAVDKALVHSYSYFGGNAAALVIQGCAG
jgi:3-oxoacyl-(acyl-carrier-protein) synthase